MDGEKDDATTTPDKESIFMKSDEFEEFYGFLFTLTGFLLIRYIVEALPAGKNTIATSFEASPVSSGCIRVRVETSFSPEMVTAIEMAADLHGCSLDIDSPGC